MLHRTMEALVKTRLEGQELCMRSSPSALVTPLRTHAHSAQMIGKMSVERRAIALFGISCMKRLEGESYDVLRKLLFIHLSQQPTQVMW
jgi:hypothetical protein